MTGDMSKATGRKRHVVSVSSAMEDTRVLQVAGTFDLSKELNMLSSFDLLPKTGDLSPLPSTYGTATGKSQKSIVRLVEFCKSPSTRRQCVIDFIL